jgi:hypothetical protein
MKRLFDSAQRTRHRFRSRTAHRAKQSRRRIAFEPLESRTLLAYSTVAGTYSVNGSFVGSVNIKGDNNADSLVISDDTATNLLIHTGDGNTGSGAGQFADQFDWDSATPGSQHLAANSASSIGFIIGAGAVTHSVTLGTPSSPASNFLSTQFTNLAGPVGATRFVTVDDSAGTTQATGANAYSIATGTGPNFIMSGPGFILNEQASANGGVTLKGGTTANTFNVTSTFGAEPINLIGGAAADTFNIKGMSSAVSVNGNGGADSAVVGNASNTFSGINPSLSISDTGGSIGVHINDSGDATARTIGVGATSVTGLTSSAITLANLSSLRVDGGTGGNTFNVSGTASGVTTTLNTGTGNDTVNVHATTGGLLVNGQDGADTANLGNAGSAQSIQGAVSINNAGSFTSVTVDDSADTTGRTVAVGVSAITGLTPATVNYSDTNHLVLDGGTGSNTFNITNPGSLDATVNSGGGVDVTNLLASNNAAIFIDGQGGTNNAVNLGNSGSLAGILVPVSVSDTGGTTTLTLDDSKGSTGRTYGVTGGKVTVSGLPSAVTVGAGVSTVAIKAGSGADTFNVDDTSAGGPTTLNLNTGSGTNTIKVLATALNTQLSINDQGTDAVSIGNAGNVQTILGSVGLVGTVPSSTALTVDDSADTTARTASLAALNLSTANLTGLAPAAISYPVATLTSAVIDTGTGDDSLSVDFTAGNPIPGGGVHYDGGSGNNILNLQGGSFTDETYTGSGPGAGTIALDGSSISFANLRPVNDVTTATNLSFTAPAGTDTLNLVDGPTFGGFQTAQFNGGVPPQFELMNFANKTNVTITGAAASTALTINNPTPAVGLSTLTINTDGGTDAADIVATPAGVALSVGLGSGNDVANVTGAGLAAGTTPILDGGPNFDTLNYDAGGGGVTPSAGPKPSEVIITRPGSGTLDTLNFEQITISGAPATPVPGTVQTITGTEGAGIVNATVATFTTPATGAKASDFLATITWGDGSSGAGVITQDASNPSVFDITATHTYAEQGAYVVGVSILSTGSTGTEVINGVPVTVITPPSGPVATTANANIADGALVVSTSSLTGTEGLTIPSGPISTFLDLGGAHPVSGYAATIQVVDAHNAVVLNVPAASIVQIGNTNSFTINAPSLTLAEEGTYTILVTVSETDVPNAASGTGSGVAVIADAALAATGAAVSATEGTPVTGTVATFTDANLAAPVSDFTALITWGDGHQSLGTITSTGPGAFSVTGTNTYAEAGSYSILVTINDVGGKSAVAASTATVSDADLTSTSVAITATEAQTFTGTVATFTDANPLAPASDFTATIDWGDGTPVTAGTIAQAADGSFFVTGTHSYADNTAVGAPQTVTVTIKDKEGANTTATSSATVLDAALTSTGATITGVEGTAFTGQVATFTDAGGPDAVGSYTVVIDWGDGKTSTPTDVTQTGTSAAGTTFLIDGGHTYADEGTYAIHVSITSAGGSATQAAGSAVVADAALTGQKSTIAATEGVALVNTTVATFTDANTDAPVSDFTALINWGDGHQSVGTVTSAGSGNFSVSGSNTYAEAGSYSVVVTITDVGGKSAVVGSTATVADAALTSTSVGITATEAQSFTGTVATFTDANALAPATDFSATVDWGDGTSVSAGTVTQAANGTFFVTGSHIYTDNTPVGAPRTVTVTIKDNEGANTTATSSATVLDASLTSTGATISAIEGKQFLGRVATFTDSGGLDPIGTYTIVINWGDGSASSPIIVIPTGPSPAGATFPIEGGHTYAEEGTYAIRVSIASAGGSATEAFGSAVVADAPLAGKTQTIAATEGVALVNTTVATFTDAGGSESPDNYAATINWGDGTPLGGASIVPGGAGLLVVGTHTYAESGTHSLTIVVHDHGGAATTLSATANVAGVPIVITGGIAGSSDTGISDTDGITNDNTPIFVGTSVPGSIVQLFATSTSSASPPKLLGVSATDAAGNWSITSPLLADDTYVIVAKASAPDGATSVTATLQTIVIDTVGPTIKSLTFDRFHGQLLIGMTDELSGLDQRSLIDGSNYAFTKANSRPGQFLITRLSATPFVSGSTPQIVTAKINGGRRLRGGQYTLTILSGGIRDIAGNALDGEFFGYFPSGNRNPGGNFVAILDTVRNRIFAPRPVYSTATPNVPPGTPGKASRVLPSPAALRAHDAALAKIHVAKVTRKSVKPHK